jgi:hypothetical protein
VYDPPCCVVGALRVCVFDVCARVVLCRGLIAGILLLGLVLRGEELLIIAATRAPPRPDLTLPI